MTTFITTATIGVIIALLGISNMMGNISSIHRYHRQRITAENIKPFGKLVGLGTLIIGIALIAFGTLTLVSEKTQLSLYAIAGTVTLILGIIAGLALSFYAMIKYNKGIF